MTTTLDREPTRHTPPQPPPVPTPPVPTVPAGVGESGDVPATDVATDVAAGQPGGGLAARVARARERLAPQADPALYQAMSDDEIAAEIALAAWMREARRRQRRRVFRAEIAGANRDRRTAADIAAREDEHRRWSERARAAQRRATSPHALTAMVHRQAVWSSWALRAVVLVGLAWSAVNVGANLMPDRAHGGTAWRVQWALGFGVEAMISVPILVVMVQATTAARLGITAHRTRIIAFEAGLLLATVGLNAGPHLAQHQFARAAEYAVAPVMVTVLIWLHARISAGYADIIARTLPPGDPGDPGRRERHDDPPATPATPHPDRCPALARDHRTAPDLHGPGSAGAGGELGDAHDDGLGDEQSGEDLRRFAAEMVRRGLTVKSEDEIAVILGLAGERTANGIANDMTRLTGANWSRSTVDRILDRAQILRARQRTEPPDRPQPTTDPT